MQWFMRLFESLWILILEGHAVSFASSPNILGGHHKETKHQVAMGAKGASRHNNAKDSHFVPAKDLRILVSFWENNGS